MHFQSFFDIYSLVKTPVRVKRIQLKTLYILPRSKTLVKLDKQLVSFDIPAVTV